MASSDCGFVVLRVISHLELLSIERKMPVKIVDFDRPPVVETVIGVQFDPLENLTNGHLGAFWKSLPSDWKFAQDTHAIPAQHERFDLPGISSGQFEIAISHDASTRLLLRNERQDRMLQLQNGRLHINWLGTSGAEYPNFVRMNSEFHAIWQRFTAFVQGELGKSCKMNQWEVTYVNRIPKGSVWTRPEEWSSAIRVFGTDMTAPCGPLEGFSGEWHYEIAPRRGRLHIRLVHGDDPTTKTSLLTMTLTARGPVEQSTAGQLSAGLELGHQAIVTTFDQLTTETAHQFWGKKDAGN